MPSVPPRVKSPFRMRLTGALAGLATAGAAAITVAGAGPADASPVRVQAAGASAAMPAGRAHQAQQVSVPGRGLDARPQSAPQAKRDKLPTAEDALKVALSQVGTTEDAGGGTKFNQWYMTTPFAKAGVARDGGSISDYANANWCDMFVTWVGAQAGVNGIGGDAFTPTHAKWFQQQGRWGSVPKPGAVVFFSWSGGKTADSIDHVGLVIKDNHDGTIQTVEGNTGNAVKIRTRSTDSVVGYGYPEYGG
jgi:surface antigen